MRVSITNGSLEELQYREGERFYAVSAPRDEAGRMQGYRVLDGVYLPHLLFIIYPVDSFTPSDNCPKVEVYPFKTVYDSMPDNIILKPIAVHSYWSSLDAD